MLSFPLLEIKKKKKKITPSLPEVQKGTVTLPGFPSQHGPLRAPD